MEERKITKYIGIDWGEKRIGLAVADDVTWFAMPLAVVYSFDELIDFLIKEEPSRLVVGMPYTMEGKSGAAVQKVKNFIGLIKERINLPIDEIDERLTSRAADSLYKDKTDLEEKDAVAAMVLLQDYIDGLDKGRKQEKKEFPKF